MDFDLKFEMKPTLPVSGSSIPMEVRRIREGGRQASLGRLYYHYVFSYHHIISYHDDHDSYDDYCDDSFNMLDYLMAIKHDEKIKNFFDHKRNGRWILTTRERGARRDAPESKSKFRNKCKNIQQIIGFHLETHQTCVLRLCKVVRPMIQTGRKARNKMLNMGIAQKPREANSWGILFRSQAR